MISKETIGFRWNLKLLLAFSLISCYRLKCLSRMEGDRPDSRLGNVRYALQGAGHNCCWDLPHLWFMHRQQGKRNNIIKRVLLNMHASGVLIFVIALNRSTLCIFIFPCVTGVVYLVSFILAQNPTFFLIAPFLLISSFLLICTHTIQCRKKGGEASPPPSRFTDHWF